jgi:peptide deformylase
MPGKKLSIVPIDQIPKEVTDCPTNDLVGLLATCLQMADICVKEHGIGLAAVQVGLPWKLFVVRYIIGPANDQFRFFVNCRYEPVGDKKEKSLEGCLSIRRPNGDFRHFEVDRHTLVRVVGSELLADKELRIEPVTLEPTGHYSFVFQHEIDHQDLVLISDIGTEYEVWK